jgi:hypothetical protein
MPFATFPAIFTLRRQSQLADCRNKPPKRLLIIQTDGDIAWNQADHDFDWTGAAD